jgi:hypothetical protein
MDVNLSTPVLKVSNPNIHWKQVKKCIKLILNQICIIPFLLICLLIGSLCVFSLGAPPLREG